MFPDLKIKIEPIPRPKFKELLKKKFLDQTDDDEFKIQLVEGYQGSGKSFFFMNLIIEESKRRPTLYVSAR